MRQSFNLVDEPWVAVRGPKGVETVSLRDAFSRAHELTSLAGDSPTQDVAVLRVMIAVLARAVEEPGSSPHEVWASLWHAGSLPMERIDGYLAAWRHRFDLLGDRAPFMQVADLTANKTSGLLKLIPEVPDGYQFFTMRAGDELASLSYAEAARWVIHAQAYDVSGIKTGAQGDDRVKGGKGYPIGSGWTGRCGIVVIEHETLRDTLLLNFVPASLDSDDEPDHPVWEREPLTSAVDRHHTRPVGPADIFTWPIRRIRLHHDGSAVTDVLLSNGDPIEWFNQHQAETMSAFRRSANQETKQKAAPIYSPHRHDVSRSLWRGLGGLLIDAPIGGAAGKDAPERRPPRTLEWIAAMSNHQQIDPDLPLRLRAVGVAYGPQDASVAADYDDMLRMHVSVAASPQLRHAAVEASAVADGAVQQLANLAGNLAQAVGRNPDGPRTSAREVAFARLDAPYRHWLGLLTADGLDDHRTKWQQQVRAHLSATAIELIDDVGEVAWLGRESRGRHVDSSLAEAWFWAGLRKNLPLAFAETDPKEES